jgi:hypothetical protein
VVPTGNEHSTAIGVWEVWVEACAPRSNCEHVSKRHTEPWATRYQSKERCFPSATWTDEKDGGQCGEAGSLEDEFVEEEGN